MLGSFKVIKNKKILVKLHLLQSIKIHLVFHPNLPQKASADLITNQVTNEFPLFIIINNRKE